MDWKKEARRLFETTDMTILDIAQNIQKRGSEVTGYLKETYEHETYKKRKTRLYRISKLGSNNPMRGKSGYEHHNWNGGVVSDGKGYLMETKPAWYMGRVGSKYVFQHTLVMCRLLGLDRLPAGFVVHHVDGDRANNDSNNLALMTTTAHQRLHSHGRCNDQGVTPVAERPSAQHPSPNGVGDDMIYSTQ